MAGTVEEASAMQVLLLLLTLPPLFFLSLSLCFGHLKRRRSNPSLSLPVSWPLVGMLPSILSHFHSINDFFAKSVSEAGNNLMFRGPLFLGMDFLITSDPANINHIFTTRFHNYPKGDDFKEMFDLLGNGILTSDQESWKLQRRMAHAALSDRKFRSFVADSSLRKIQHGLIPFLHGVARGGTVVDLQDVFIRHSFDVACLAVFGLDTMSPSTDSSSPARFATAMRDAENAVHFRHVVPPIFWKLQRWLNIGSERKLGKAAEVMDQFIGEQISKRRSKGHAAHDDDSDMLTSYMNRELDSSFLRDTALTFLFAGNSTVATTLSWLVYLIAKHPRVERKILDELEAARLGDEEQSSFPGARAFDNDELRSMVYLYATVLETLRLFPSVPLDHKGVMGDDVLPSGVEVKAGMRIIIAINAMGRDKQIWGEDCAEFRPERWISDIDGSIRHEPSYNFMTFGTGPRTCVGKDFALRQLKMVVAAVIYNFQIEVVEGQDVKPADSITLYMANGCKVRVKKRGRSDI